MSQVLQTTELYLEQSRYTTGLNLEKHLRKTRAGQISVVSGLVSSVMLLLTVWFVLERSVTWKFLGFFEMTLAFFLAAGIYYLFGNFLQQDRILTVEQVERGRQQEAYGVNLTFFSAQILATAGLGEHLVLPTLFRFLSGTEQFRWVLRRLNIPIADFLKRIETAYAPGSALLLSDVLKLSWQKAFSHMHLQVEYGDLLVAVYELDQAFQKIILDFELEVDDLRSVASWQRRLDVGRKARGRFWERQNLLNTKGIGKDWAGGFTVKLDKVALDLTRHMQIYPAPPHLYGHREQLDLLERTLIQSGHVALVGLPGVGRHTLLQAFASKMNWGQTYGPLRYQRLLVLDPTALVTGAASLNDVVARIENLLGEAYAAENVILVINDFDAILDPHPEAGRVNATEALLQFLQSRLRIIGVTTPHGYQATVGKNPQVERFLPKIELSEPNSEEALSILQSEALILEYRHHLWFTHQALKEAVKLATKLIQNLPNPEKSLEILDTTATFVATKTSDQIVFASHVQQVITMRTKIPVEKVAGAEVDLLLNLEDLLHERIVNQQSAIGELANALRRARSGIRSEKKPIGVFLFLGPTGVGKTETAKALATVYFGSEERIIRLDMSEYQEIHSLNRLIGDSDTQTGGQLTEAVISSPFSLILLDELEKAHPKILDLFLQVFDEGRLTDAVGRTISFVNTMIIATSNAGAEIIREMVRRGEDPAASRDQIFDSIQKQGIFRPEFLNRFDAALVFRPLNEDELTQVAILLLRDLNGRLKEKNIEVKITPELALAIARGGHSPEYGARPLRRFIQDQIENQIAKGLISGKIQRGQTVDIDPSIFSQSTS